MVLKRQWLSINGNVRPFTIYWFTKKINNTFHHLDGRNIKVNKLYSDIIFISGYLIHAMNKTLADVKSAGFVNQLIKSEVPYR